MSFSVVTDQTQDAQSRTQDLNQSVRKVTDQHLRWGLHQTP